MSCDFFSDEERLLLSVITRMMKKENKKIKDARVGEKVKQSRNVGGGDTEKPHRPTLVAPAHIRSGVVSLYSESHQTLNIYDSPNHESCGSSTGAGAPHHR